MRRTLAVCFGLIVTLALAWTAFSAFGPGRATSAHAAAGKRITISLSKERLRAWEGSRVVLSTPVTTGDRLLPTPTGYFSIVAKFSPYTMVSPWPPSSPYWYPTSSMNWAMEFDSRGYFIHDAPWRSVYGRGSNSGTQPGTNYGGTHGCVNVPYYAMRFLYSWAPQGTPVHIVP
ncbi:MAG: L,D-transpeptidase [Chloroflexi bacterium]|nr:L,D-transpeptidase [Chloroflexota bacterium]